MDEIEIQTKAKNLKIPNFLGTFPINKLPIASDSQFCFILNHDRHNEPGSHWVSVLVLNDNTVEYYDSLGQKPPQALYQWKKNIFFNDKPIQNIFSNACGHHSIYYLYRRLVLKHSRAIVLKYLLQLRNPDLYVKKFIINS